VADVLRAAVAVGDLGTGGGGGRGRATATEGDLAALRASAGGGWVRWKREPSLGAERREGAALREPSQQQSEAAELVRDLYTCHNLIGRPHDAR